MAAIRDTEYRDMDRTGERERRSTEGKGKTPDSPERASRGERYCEERDEKRDENVASFTEMNR